MLSRYIQTSQAPKRRQRELVRLRHTLPSGPSVLRRLFATAWSDSLTVSTLQCFGPGSTGEWAGSSGSCGRRTDEMFSMCQNVSVRVFVSSARENCV